MNLGARAWGIGCLAAVLGGCGGGGGATQGDASGDDARDSKIDSSDGAEGDAGDAPPEVATDAPATDADAAAADAMADAAPALTGVLINPELIDFGSQKQGVATPGVTVTVTNASAAAVTIGTVALGGANAADFSTANDTCSSKPLAAQARCAFDVAFTPQALAARAATFTIPSTSPGSPTTGTLAGTGVAMAPALSVSPAKLSFGTIVVGASSAPTTITLTNNGTTAVTVTSAMLAGDAPADFTLGADTCTGKGLAPAASCTVAAMFGPHAVCKVSRATLTFVDGAPDSPQVVTLTGTGFAGTPGAFGAVLYCTSPAAQPERLAALANGNVGFTEHGSRSAPAALATVNATDGVHESSADLLLNGWAPHDLTVAPDGSLAYYEENFGAGNGLTLDVAPLTGARAMVPSFLGITGPLAAGPDGAFWFTSDHICDGATSPFLKKVVGGAAVDFTMPAGWILGNMKTTCAATTILTAGPDGNLWLGVSQGNQSRSGFIRITPGGVFVDFIPTTDGDPVAAAMGANGKLYALIGAARASSCRLAAFDAKGVETLAVSLADGSGLSCAALATGADGRLWRTGMQLVGTAFVDALAGFDPKTAKVTLYPSPPAQYLAAGPDEGLWFNSGPSAVGRFDLGGGSARAFVLPKSIGFLPGAVGATSPARAVTVRSTGPGPLTIAKVSLADPDPAEFVLTDACAGQVLAPGATCTIMVSSKPTRDGSSTASVVIESDDAFGAQLVALGKFTPPPAPRASPAKTSFAGTLVGKHGGKVTLTLTNPAEKAVSVAGVNLRGTHATDFDLVADQCGGTTLAPKDSCTVTVRFTPTAAGARTATVTFTDAATPPTQTVVLTGTGLTVGGGADGGTGTCDCTGAFVDPSVVDPSGAVTSPNGVYTLAVVSGDAQHPVASLTVTKAGVPVLAYTPPAGSTWPTESPWGFSPDDNRFVIHYQNNGLDWIELFDLTSATPTTHVWSTSLPVAPGTTGASPAGSIAFSPHGDYLVATQVQTPAGSLLQTVFLYLVRPNGVVAKTTSWSPYRVPNGSQPNTKVDSAFWGFGPDDRSFTFVSLDANGTPTLSLLALPSGTSVQSRTFMGTVASYVQYAPCGETLAIVDQLSDPQQVSPTNSVSITAYATTTAQAALGNVSGLPVADSGISLAATASLYTAQSADFPNVLTVAPNTGAGVCRAP